jgi:hypothetical protein
MKSKHNFMFSKVFPENRAVVQKYDRAAQATEGNYYVTEWRD